MPAEWAGWPDRLFIGPEGIFWRELKSEDGRASRAQLAFGHSIKQAGGNWAIWRPDDWRNGTIADQLARLAR
jgi:hypothetical protein